VAINLVQTKKILHRFGLEKCSLHSVCNTEKPHLFEGAGTICGICRTEKSQTIIQASISIAATIKREFQSPITVLKSLEYLKEGIAEPFNPTF